MLNIFKYLFCCRIKQREYIYILELEENKWYIGRTKNIDKRIDAHMSGNGSDFTKKFKVKSVYKIYSMKTNFDEDNKVKEYMMLYGVDNVRGGTYSTVNLSKEKKKFLIDEFNHYNNCCFKCGMKDHYVKDCSSAEDAPCGRASLLVTFGKHKNKFIKDVPSSYINWCRKQKNPGKDIVKLLEIIDSV
jgi:predicted GIY-YIG superfamily endonuclease